MKMSKREIIIGIVTMATILFGITYSLAGSKIGRQHEQAKEKTRLLRQMKIHKRILETKESWTGRLDELKTQLPVYDTKISVTGEILKLIKRMADQNRLDLTQSRPAPEKQIGSLYELSITCDWEGELDALVHFLHGIHSQGLRFDIRELNVRPDARRAGILRGNMIIDCAYRRSIAEENETL